MAARRLKGDSPDPDRVLKDLEAIQNTSDRIAGIVRGLKAFSRNSEGDPFSEASAVKILRESIDLCSDRFKRAGIEIRSQVRTDGLISCRFNQISQILVNLLGNSFDAVEPLSERWVEVELSQSGKQVEFTVRDSGQGIPAEFAKKIMQPFFTTKHVGKGTGLGLSISRELAEIHGGNLRYLAEEAHTTFLLSIPAAGVSRD